MVGFAKQSTGRLIHEDGSQVGTSSMASSSGDNVVPLRAPSCSEYEGNAPAAGADLSRVVTVLGAYRWISRDLGSALTDREIVLLLWLIDRTVGWQKWECTVTYRLLSEGDRFSQGLGKQKRQLIETVASLVDKGVIRTTAAGVHGLTISVNFDWSPKEGKMLATPKRLHGAQKDVDSDAAGWGDSGAEIRTEDVRKSAPKTCGNPHPFKGQSKGKLVEDNILPVARSRVRPVPPVSPVEEVQETIPPQTTGGDVSRSPAERVRERVEGSRRSANEAKTDHRSSLRPADVLKTWRIAFEGAYADVPGAMCPTPTREDAMKLKAAVINKWTRSPAELHDFVDFTVRNWSNMAASSFPWMKLNPPPVFPTLRFFIGQHVNVIDYWSKVRRNDWINSFDRDDQSRLRAFTLRDGLTREAALAKLGEEKAERRLREENERIRREANEKLSTALIALDRAGNQPVYGVHNPHPQSAAAKRAALGPAVPQEKLQPGAVDAAVDTFLATDFSTLKDIEE